MLKLIFYWSLQCVSKRKAYMLLIWHRNHLKLTRGFQLGSHYPFSKLVNQGVRLFQGCTELKKPKKILGVRLFQRCTEPKKPKNLKGVRLFQRVRLLQTRQQVCVYTTYGDQECHPAWLFGADSSPLGMTFLIPTCGVNPYPYPL